MIDLGTGCVVFFGYFIIPVFWGEGSLARGVDGSVQSFPWLVKVSNGWRSLTPPLWDFASFSGTTFIGELQPGVLYPGNLVFAMLAPDVTQGTFNAYIAAHYVLAFTFMLLLLRRFEFGVIPRLLGAFAFAAYLDWSQPNRLLGMVFLPLLIVSVHAALTSGHRPARDPSVYLSGIVLAVMFMAGHQQPAVHSAIAVIFYAVIVCWERKQSSFLIPAKLAGTFTIAALVSAPQWLLTVEYISRAYRWAPTRTRGFERVPYEVFGRSTISSELLGYISWSWMPVVAAAVLLLVAIRCLKNQRLAIFALASGVLALLASLGDSAYISRLTWHVPILSMLWQAERYIFIMFFCAAILLAVLSEWLMAPRSRKLWRWAGRVAVLVLAVWLFGHSHALLKAQDDSEPLSPRNQFARTPIIEELVQRHAAEPYYRVFNFRQCIARNAGNAFGFLTIRGHRATIYAPYHDFIVDALGDPSHRKHDLLGVRYVVSPQPLELELLLEEENLFLYERSTAPPVFYSRESDGTLVPAPIETVVWNENSVTLTLTGEFERTLTFAQPYYPGWEVTVDGRERALLKLGLFQGVQLTSEDREINFCYNPPLFHLGLGLALIPIVLVIVLGIDHSRLNT